MAPTQAQPTLSRRLAAEGIGTMFLLISIVGTGILATNLASGNVAIAVLAVTLAVAATLYAIITMFVPISGAHFNPAVTLMVAWLGDLKWREVPAYILAQLAGGTLGVVLSNLMFDLPAIHLSASARTGPGIWLGELVATFGLFVTIWATARLNPKALPMTVAGYVFAAIWFTSSTCFANPAVTFARMFSDTLTGIRPVDVPMFIVMQLVGAVAATGLLHWLIPTQVAEYIERVVPEQKAARKRAASGPLAPLD